MDGVLARQRVRMDAVKFEGDVINPWAYDKASKKFVPNEAFIRRDGANAHNFFKAEDLEKSHPKLAANLGKERETYEQAKGVGEYEKEFSKLVKSI